jgi:hypothetical protein
MTKPQNEQEFDDLLNQLCEEQLSERGWQRLVELLGQSGDHRRRYLDYVELHASLWSGGVARPSLSLPLPEALAPQKSPAARASPVLGFLGNLGRDDWPASLGPAISGYLTFFAALIAIFVTALFFAPMARFDPLKIARVPATNPPAATPSAPQLPAGEGQGGSAPAPAVARLTRSYDCDWAERETAPADGDGLKAGRLLALRSGLAEIVFASGARVILQGPASFQLESPRSAVLSGGKVTVTVEDAAAKGFTIHAPGMKAIDLGTEFGLEVSANGVEQVHVFRGAVDVTPSPEKGPAAPAHRLTAAEGMEVDLNTQGVKLVANNGERFARSLDDAQKKQHVVAYWRFEDHPVGVLVPESQEGRAPVRGSLDSSINGNDLYTWNNHTQPKFSADVPAAVVTHSGEANAASLDITSPSGVAGAATRDLFTMSAWSRPSRIDLQAITPLRWTIEASVKAVKLNGRFQVFVVRDGMKVSSADPKLTPLAFQITPKKRFEILFCDVAGRSHVATAEAVAVEENHWYHVAATSDGENLKLYVDALDGKGYLLWAITGLPTTGSNAMARGTYPTNDPLDIPSGAGYPYIWSVGRGYYGGQVGNWFQGWIDEVRICDVALGPEEFLFVPKGQGKNRQPATDEQLTK